MFKKFLTVENLKKYRDVFYFIIICILLYVAVVALKREKTVVLKDKNNKDLYESTIKNLKGNLAYEINQRILKEAEYRARIDSVARLLAIKPKFIKGEDSYIYKTKDSFITKTEVVYVPKYRDSAYKFNFQDLWTNIDGTVSRMHSDIIYSSVDTIGRIETSKTSIFGNTTRKVILTNANPHVTLRKGYSYVQKEKRTWLTIGPSIQLNPFTLKLDYGISVQYPLIQLKR